MQIRLTNFAVLEFVYTIYSCKLIVISPETEMAYSFFGESLKRVQISLVFLSTER